MPALNRQFFTPMPHLLRTCLLAWLSISLMLFTGCTETASDQQAIRTLLQERQQALATRNPDRYTAILSAAYRDKGQDFTAKSAELAQTISSWEQISFSADAHRITIRGTSATARAAYQLRVSKQGKTYELAGEEELRLQRESGGWKIVGGL